MHFTDIFIKRPVLAVVVSLVILLLGLRSAGELKVREYPKIQNAQITVTTAYPGADPALVEGFVTRPLEREIAAADGIDFLASTSGQSVSSITANLDLDKNPNDAMTEIAAKVNKLRSQLPQGSEDPTIQLGEARGTAALFLSFTSKKLSIAQLTDYVVRLIQPEIAAIPGVEGQRISGAREYAMRVWLDPQRLAAHDMTPGEVFTAIRNQNVLSPVGETRGNLVKVGITATTGLKVAQEFQNLALRSDGNQLVRLKDVADVVFGDENYDTFSAWDTEPGIILGLQARPDANVLEVVSKVRALWPRLKQALPEGIDAEIAFDATVDVNESIVEVKATMLEAVLIVILVIFLFLGSVRSSLIPAVTVPLSLVGALFLIYTMDFSINLLTLLAMVLAIGMVVDDAIIVLENIHRHIEEGMSPKEAAVAGARELLGPIVAMTITLVAVYAPIGFLTGITGTLFTEFAFTLAGAVLISGVIALTLTPMMCSKILTRGNNAKSSHRRLEKILDEKFDAWRHSYKRSLHSALNQLAVIAVFGLIVLGSCYLLFRSSPSELVPAEDRRFAGAFLETEGYSSSEYLINGIDQAQRLARTHPNVEHVFSFIMDGGGTSRGFVGLVTQPPSERKKTLKQITADISESLSAVPSVKAAVFQPPAIPTPGQGFPVEVVLKSTADPTILAQVGDEVVQKALASKRYFVVSSQMKVDRPEAKIVIDRNKAALLGIDMQHLGLDLVSMMAGAQVNRFSFMGQSYKVITQVQRSERLNPEQLTDFYIRTGSGKLVPLSTVARIELSTEPRSIPHAQQLTSNTITAVPRPDLSQGDAIALMETIAKDVMPSNFILDYGGSSRQFKQESSVLAYTLFFALIVIYLVLAAQYESFRDPLIILVSVPMSISGALLCLNIFALTNGMGITGFPGMTLNIYTQVGLITLIGVISKHGILIVDFANRLQQEGMTKRQAVEEAASIRLRPILMTTAALVLAMVPLLTSSGSGASARFSMGMVIASGMTIGTLFTLYVVPAMYMFIGRDYSRVQADAPPVPAT